MTDRHRIRVDVQNYVASPVHGPEAYYISSASVYLPFGKKHKLKTKNKVLEFISSKLTDEFLKNYDVVGYSVMNGYSGMFNYVKGEKLIHSKSDKQDVNEHQLIEYFKIE